MVVKIAIMVEYVKDDFFKQINWFIPRSVSRIIVKNND